MKRRAAPMIPKLFLKKGTSNVLSGEAVNNS